MGGGGDTRLLVEIHYSWQNHDELYTHSLSRDSMEGFTRVLVETLQGVIPDTL